MRWRSSASCRHGGDDQFGRLRLWAALAVAVIGALPLWPWPSRRPTIGSVRGAGRAP